MKNNTFCNKRLTVGTLTEEDKKNILKLFYRTDLEENEKVIDNRDSYIANKLNIKKRIVSEFLTRHLNVKFANLPRKQL